MPGELEHAQRGVVGLQVRQRRRRGRSRSRVRHASRPSEPRRPAGRRATHHTSTSTSGSAAVALTSAPSASTATAGSVRSRASSSEAPPRPRARRADRCARSPTAWNSDDRIQPERGRRRTPRARGAAAARSTRSARPSRGSRSPPAIDRHRPGRRARRPTRAMPLETVVNRRSVDRGGVDPLRPTSGQSASPANSTGVLHVRVRVVDAPRCARRTRRSRRRARTAAAASRRRRSWRRSTSTTTVRRLTAAAPGLAQQHQEPRDRQRRRDDAGHDQPGPASRSSPIAVASAVNGPLGSRARGQDGLERRARRRGEDRARRRKPTIANAIDAGRRPEDHRDGDASEPGARRRVTHRSAARRRPYHRGPSGRDSRRPWLAHARARSR